MRLDVGVATATINPRLPVALAGYGARRHKADAVHDDLTVRTVVLRDRSGTTVALLVFDLLSLRDEFSDPIRAAVAEELGLAPGAVLTACVHTHGGPSCIPGGEVLGWNVQPGYVDVLVDAARKTAAEAVADLRPAVARHATVTLPEGTGTNRRKRTWDPSAGVLTFTADDGTPIVTIANFGLHPVVHGPEHCVVNTDWVGPFRAALAQAVGGTVVFLQGCEGDVNPASTAWDRSTDDALAHAAELGHQLAQAFVTPIEAAAPIDGDAVTVWSRTVSVPVAPTVYSVLSKLRNRKDLELVEWAIGAVRLVGVPGEATQGFQRSVEDARPHPIIWAGLAPAAHGYLPEPFRFGYEEAMSLGRQATDVLRSALTAGPEVPVPHVAAAPAEAVDVRRVDTRSGRIEVARCGPADGPPVLIVHGMPGSWRQGLALAQDLAELHHVVLPSRPGYGRTPLGVGRTPVEQAASYVAVLDSLGFERVLVVGISGGGPSAAAMAQHFGDRVAGLVLACALAPHLMPVPKAMAVARRLPAVPEAVGAVQRWRGRRAVLGPDPIAPRRKDLTESERRWLEEDPTIADGILRFMRSHLDAPAGLPGLRNDVDNIAAARRDGPPATDRITAPTVVMHGDEDKVVDLDHGRFWAGAIPGAHLDVIRGAGHLFLVTRRSESLPKLGSYLMEMLGATY